MCVESEDHSGREGGVVKGRDQIRNGQVIGRTVRITIAGDVVRAVKVERGAGGVSAVVSLWRRQGAAKRWVSQGRGVAEEGGAVERVVSLGLHEEGVAEGGGRLDEIRKDAVR